MSKNMITSPPKGNKNSTPGKKAAKKPPAKKSGSSTASPGPGRVTIRVGAKVIRLALAGLDQAAVQDLVEQLGQGKLRTAPVELEVGDIAGVDPADRTRFWTLYLAVRGDGTRPVALRAGGNTFAQPTDWAASGLAVSTDNPEEGCRARNLAADVLANAYAPADRDVYLDAITAKLRDRGFGTAYCEEVKRNIRQRLREHGRTAGTEKSGGGGAGVCDLAKLFLNDCYPADGGGFATPTDDPASPPGIPAFRLRYYDERFYRRRAGVWAETTAEDVRLELTSYLQKVAPDRTGMKPVGDVFMNLKALCAVRVDGTPPLPFHLADSDRRMLALQNGLLDLTALARGEEPELLPQDPNWFSTARLPYKFDPDARCPRFTAFLGQILNADPKKLKPLKAGDNRVRVVQELFGYSLLPDNRFQVFGIFTGKGRNGKGTLFDAWGRLIGPENVSSVPLESMAKEFGTEPLIGKMLNLAGDMNDVDATVEGTLKSWTGEDRVTVPRKYKAALQVEPTVKFIYGCNKLPWFKDKSDGVWRRLIVVPFDYKPKTAGDVDSKLRSKLKAELPGILNWALAGLARLLVQDGFTACEVCEGAKSDHRNACAPVAEFIGDQFTLASEYAGPKAGKKWMTTTTEIKLLVKEYNAKFGERVIAPHVVCRELAGTEGVFTYRPKRKSGRAEYGTIFCGVCVGEPKQIVPGDLDEIATKTGLDELSSAFVAGPKPSVGAKQSMKGKSAKGQK